MLMIYKISDQILSFLFISIQVPLVGICIAEMWEQNMAFKILGIDLIFRNITEYNKIILLYCSLCLELIYNKHFSNYFYFSLGFFFTDLPTLLLHVPMLKQLRLMLDYSDKKSPNSTCMYNSRRFLIILFFFFILGQLYAERRAANSRAWKPLMLKLKPIPLWMTNMMLFV